MAPQRGAHWWFGELLASASQLAALLAPLALLAGAAWRLGGPAAWWLALGIGVQVLLLAGVLVLIRSWALPLTMTFLLTCVTALGFLWWSVPLPRYDWYLHLAQGLLTLATVGIVSDYLLQQSGAWVVRQAHRLVRELRQRSTWPEPLAACRDLPEVAQLREALVFDAAPALSLLTCERPEVRLCALTALEFRKHWRPGQMEAVLATFRKEAVPEVREAAILALAHCDDRLVVECLADSLRDPDPRVRTAAAEVLIWSPHVPWTWVRFGVRKSLSDTALRGDSSCLREGKLLTNEAVHDLTAWTAEKGILGLRSTQLLAAHYATLLQENPADAVPILHQIVMDAHAAPLLRIEAGRLLLHGDHLDHASQEQLLDPMYPAPLRLLAAEKLLQGGPHVRAIVCLRELARLPNRELALATAAVVQRNLGVDLGLALGQNLPPLNSQRAIDVTRRLMAWASQPDATDHVLEAALTSTHLPRP